jgi:hypothetical protein
MGVGVTVGVVEATTGPEHAMESTNESAAVLNPSMTIM